MENLDKRISALFKAVGNWLHSDNQYLERAVQRTVEEEYFSEYDVQFALDWLRDCLTESNVREWISRVGLDDVTGRPDRTVLCLHAGNLPLVGFQDAFATILSGATYYGKISRKDPYLLPVFLNEIKKTDFFSGIDIQWTHNLSDLEGLQTDAVLFAGSEESVPGVMDSINRLNLSKDSTEYLIRTAHFSLAYIDDANPENLRDLADAIFRYGGMGCRSVAVVVSPTSLEEVGEDLREYAESFWEANPPHQKPPPRIKHRYAYNRSVDRTQLLLEHFLIQEGGWELDLDRICYWEQGDRQRAAELADSFGDRLQSVYVPNPEIEIPGWEDRTEPLAEAQTPPIQWKPDGMDTLEWLVKS